MIYPQQTWLCMLIYQQNAYNSKLWRQRFSRQLYEYNFMSKSRPIVAQQSYIHPQSKKYGYLQTVMQYWQQQWTRFLRNIYIQVTYIRLLWRVFRWNWFSLVRTVQSTCGSIRTHFITMYSNGSPRQARVKWLNSKNQAQSREILLTMTNKKACFERI